jgi:uncharacterized protein (TIGR03084 family)
MGLDYPRLLADLRAESDNLIAVLHRLADGQWSLATPAVGWSIQDQISHLAFFDDVARLALTHPDAFRAEADQLISGGMDFPDRIAAQYRTLTPERQLEWFVAAREKLLSCFDGDDPKRRLPWFGPDMSVASSATARLMETWAHGQDVYDTIGMAHPPSPGLRSIAHLGVATFAFAHTLHGVDVPEQPIRVALRSPGGDEWSWGPEDAINQVRGPAEDFVLTVTQRRHWTETGLTAVGPVAGDWLDIAQIFAGAPSRRAIAK